MTRREKTKKLILIIFLMLVCSFLISTYYKTPPKQNIVNRQDPLNAKQVLPVENTVLEINGIKYESKISNPTSVFNFMTQLQNEGKITFKEKNYSGMGEFIEEINGIKNGSKNWIYYVNGQKAEVGVSNYEINIGDTVSWKYE